ncbi:RluA family pseudouridine synthase [Enterococcus cecorum]|uniref:Pseudouridine synthase n=1 Tax=Enterococcus cecorum TaxID=44008 RepID=A0A200HS52_9ENTE|nr:RluA family pseudouridine synthase [Enterococcus cecorum]KLN91413.1 pseudouridine synthase [Enterococcus cecorum]KLN92539.1 pseudouridine synthase [Enterococcus cecorum]OUZ14885.1 ribosomal large subunit pseudouridine synthase [Enterococcus cecorum]CAI3259069.1 RluA family pseudouridine synthase [Enterococcus cecorum]CAI3263617.1 RluA family pseudouridine synthase [Enterococcus cecorum]
MQFQYIYEKTAGQQLKYFLKEQGISKGLLAKIKFQGGQIAVNGRIENVLYQLKAQDVVQITIPDEGEHETVLLDETPIDIVYEDAHLLVVNKPANVASIPAQYHPNGTMANRVKAYYKRQNYANQVIHVVTRLDRDTSGLMVFAKHGFAHAKLDVQLRNKQFVKRYQALVTGEIAQLQNHALIDLPIARDYDSLLKRKIDDSGKQAKTEYWLEKQNQELALVDIQLHTGRTHQIRVHFAAIGCPLRGDELYGGLVDKTMNRQALHCYELQFTHPFTQEALHFTQALPQDMADLAQTIK